MTTTIKINETTRNKLKALKRLWNVRSLNDIVDELSTKELNTYCYTIDGYAKVGDNLQLDDGVYEIIDIADNTVYAKCKDVVTEFYARGKVAWNARIVNE